MDRIGEGDTDWEGDYETHSAQKICKDLDGPKP